MRNVLLVLLLCSLNLLVTTAQSAQECYQQGETALAEADYEAAIEAFTCAIRNSYSPVAAAFSRRGDVYFAMRDYEAALDSYNSALDVNENYYDARVGRGRAYHQLGDYEAAKLELEAAIATNPGDVNALTWLGATYNGFEQLGMYQLAYETLTDALRRDPTYADAYFERGRNQHFTGNYELALNDFTTALQYRQDARYYLWRGRSEAALGNLRDAIRNYNAAIGLTDDRAAIYHQRGLAFFALDDIELALTSYADAIENDPAFAPVYQTRGNLLINLERYAEAQRDLCTYLELVVPADEADFDDLSATLRSSIQETTTLAEALGGCDAPPATPTPTEAGA